MLKYHRWREMRKWLALVPGSPKVFGLKRFHISSNVCLGLGRKKVKDKRREHFYETITPWKTEEDLLKTLTVDNLIHEDDNLVVINKPNCVPMAGGEIQHIPVTAAPNEVVQFSIKSVLPLLKKTFNTEYLEPIYSLPRLYSGIIILCKTEKGFKWLRTYFRHLRTQGVLAQKFWVVTFGVPEEQNDAVSFALKKVEVQGQTMSVKAAEYSINSRKRKEVSVGKMCHTVKNSQKLPGGDNAKVSLVELQTSLVKWENIECYFTDECMCPVLGDCVYSPRITSIMGKTVKLSPERALARTLTLPFDVKSALDLSTDREVLCTPLHIHLRELEIPDLTKRKKDRVSFTAPLPVFYSKTLELLKLEDVQTE